MIRYILLTTCLPTILSAACPATPERSELHIELMEQVAIAPDEATARDLTNRLWDVWSTAPDETAQEILQRGMERRASYDFAGALQDFDALIEYCPSYAEGYNQRAFVNFIRQDYAIALDDLDRAVALMPDHFGAVVGRALALLQLGRTQEGQIALRAALALNPWLPERNRLQPLESLPEAPKTDL